METIIYYQTREKYVSYIRLYVPGSSRLFDLKYDNQMT